MIGCGFWWPLQRGVRWRIHAQPPLRPATAPTCDSWLSATFSKELKMKALLAACVLLSALTSAAISGTVTVQDNSSALPGVAAATTELLLDARLKPRSAGGGLLVVEAKNFHCDQVLN